MTGVQTCALPISEDGMSLPRRAGAGDTSAFFVATLVLWAVSVGFEIGALGRRELLTAAACFAFFQTRSSSTLPSRSSTPPSPSASVSYLCSVVPMVYQGP